MRYPQPCSQLWRIRYTEKDRSTSHAHWSRSPWLPTKAVRRKFGAPHLNRPSNVFLNSYLHWKVIKINHCSHNLFQNPARQAMRLPKFVFVKHWWGPAELGNCCSWYWRFMADNMRIVQEGSSSTMEERTKMRACGVGVVDKIIRSKFELNNPVSCIVGKNVGRSWLAWLLDTC